MQFRTRRRDEPDIVVIPLIDVLLMLLIFFMLATTFSTDTRIRVNLPEASESPEKKEEQKQEPINLVIDAQGRFFVDDQELINTEFKTLKRNLEKRVAGLKELPPLTIRADAKTPHQAVMTAMDAAGQVGLVNMSFPAKQRQEP